MVSLKLLFKMILDYWLTLIFVRGVNNILRDPGNQKNYILFIYLLLLWN